MPGNGHRQVRHGLETRPKRVLFATTISTTLRAFLLPAAAHFRAKGWKVCAVAHGASSCPECVVGFDEVFDIDWSRNPLKPANLVASTRQLRELVKRAGIDLVHVHTPVAGFVTRLALRKRHRDGGALVIYTAHGFHFHSRGGMLRNAAFRSLEKLAGRWTDALVVINREDEREALRHRIVAANRLYYMPGIGIDTDLYSPRAVSLADVQSVRGELNLTDSAIQFLMVAEFTPGKRHRDALAALARLSRPDVFLVFAGEGKGLAEAREFARKLGVERQTRFLGQRRDIPRLIKGSRAVVLCSDREGLPRSVMEALSLEVPVIGTRVRGTAELVEGGCGMLVDVGDVVGLADSMAWMADHPDEAAERGRLGRGRMKDYDVKKVIKLHEELYDHLLGKR